MAGNRKKTNAGRDFAFMLERNEVITAVREILTETGMFLVRAGVENVYAERHPEEPPLSDDEVYYAVDNVVFNTLLPLPNGFDVRREVVNEVRSIYLATGKLVGLAAKATEELVKMFVGRENFDVGRHREFIREAVERKVASGLLKFEKEKDAKAYIILEGDEEEEEEEEDEEEEEEKEEDPVAPVTPAAAESASAAARILQLGIGVSIAVVFCLVLGKKFVFSGK